MIISPTAASVSRSAPAVAICVCRRSLATCGELGRGDAIARSAAQLEHLQIGPRQRRVLRFCDAVGTGLRHQGAANGFVKLGHFVVGGGLHVHGGVLHRVFWP
ncbi:hypothetical protein GO496_04645 [Acidovorax citrulli]|nr:hypothetical protein [Paracidovorax citrulli]